MLMLFNFTLVLHFYVKLQSMRVAVLQAVRLTDTFFCSAGASPVHGAAGGGGVPGAELDPGAAPGAAAAAEPARSAATLCVLSGGPATILPNTASPGVLAEPLDRLAEKQGLNLNSSCTTPTGQPSCNYIRFYRKEPLEVDTLQDAALRLETCTPESHRVWKALPGRGDLRLRDYAVVKT